MRDRLKRSINAFFVTLLILERRIDPYFRGSFDRVFQRPLARLAQALINFRRPNNGLGIAEERRLPDEDASTQGIVDAMSAFVRRTYPDGGAERAGNTKTYGVVRAELSVLPELPHTLRHGVFAE